MWGALSTLCFVAGLFFLKYWRRSRERLFLIFAAAFWVFSVHWIGLSLVDPKAEEGTFFYMLRLFAFTLIIVGIIDKNRAPSNR
jgi:hypothetical protein